MAVLTDTEKLKIKNLEFNLIQEVDSEKNAGKKSAAMIKLNFLREIKRQLNI